MRACIVQNISLTEHLGLSTYLFNISKNICKFSDLELFVIVSKSKKNLPIIDGDVEIVQIDSNTYSIPDNLLFAKQAVHELIRINKNKPIDIIHCVYPFSSLIAATLFKRRYPAVKLVYDIRSPWIDMSAERSIMLKRIGRVYKSVTYCIEKILIDNADGYIFITEGLMNHYANKMRIVDKPYSIVPSGVDLKRFTAKSGKTIRARYGIRDDDLLLGYVGGIAKIRNLDFVIRGFREALSYRKDLKLMMVGDGDDLNSLKYMASRMGCSDRIIFTGKVNYDQIPAYISSFDFGLCHLPDKLIFRYSYPIKILEYLASGVPVLASNIWSHIEISKKLNGIIIYDDFSSFVSLLRNIGRNGNLNNKTLVYYDWSNVSLAINSFWHRLIE